MADPVDEVYAASLDEFVAARTRAVAALKQAGDAERAAEIGALRKPAVHVWALNQSARAHADGARELARAAEAVAAVQARRATGDLHEATERLREAGSALVREAERLLEEAGRPVSDATRNRVAALVRLVAANEEARQALVEGRLLEEPEEAGFGSLGTVGDVPVRPPQSRARSAPERPSKAEAARQRRREQHEAHVRELEEALAEAERDVSAADGAVREAQRAAVQAAKRRDSLARSLERLRARG